MRESIVRVQRIARKFLNRKKIRDAHMRTFLKNYYIPFLKDILRESSRLYNVNVPIEKLYKDRQSIPPEHLDDYKPY